MAVEQHAPAAPASRTPVVALGVALGWAVLQLLLGLSASFSSMTLQPDGPTTSFFSPPWAAVAPAAVAGVASAAALLLLRRGRPRAALVAVSVGVVAGVPGVVGAIAAFVAGMSISRRS